MSTDSRRRRASAATAATSADARPGKRERLVVAARELMYRRGVARTSLADIAELADVPAGNVYYYFKTKDEIVSAVVDTYAEQLRTLLAQLEQRHSSPAARLTALVGALAEQAARSIVEYGAQYGCPYGSLSSELARQADAPDPLAMTLMRIPLEWAEQQFRALGRSDAPDLAVELIAAYEGSAVLTSTLGRPEIMAGQTRRLQRWIETLEAR